MAIIGPVVQYDLLTRLQFVANYEQMIATSNLNYVTDQLDDLSEDKDVDMESDEVQELKDYQEMYQTEVKLRDTEIAEYTEQMKSLEKVISNGVKDSFGLKFSQG